MEKSNTNRNDQTDLNVGYYFGFIDQKVKSNSYIIGIVDSSGSMSSCWPGICTEWNSIADKTAHDKISTIK